MKKAVQFYKDFIDGIVEISDGVEERWVMERGWPKIPENDEINDFMNSLSRPQKRVLVRLLKDARDGGIHDVLVYLHDAISIDNVKLVSSGRELPVNHFESMYYDWVCRREGDAWPDERRSAKSR
jgi:hypothetical protein